MIIPFDLIFIMILFGKNKDEHLIAGCKYIQKGSTPEDIACTLFGVFKVNAAFRFIPQSGDFADCKN